MKRFFRHFSAVSAVWFLANALLVTPVRAADTDGDGVLDSRTLAVSAGGHHSCAIDAVGVHCWGDNTAGQTDVPVLSLPQQVSAGNAHTCALDASGVHCWGYNGSGQTDVPTLNAPIAVSAGMGHSCAIDADGVKCWGYNDKGQASPPVLSHPVQISAGSEHSCALADTGVECWGDDTAGQSSVPELVNPVAVSAGDSHTCAIDDNGVQCWGSDAQGQSTVPALSHPVAVSAGFQHTCAIDDSGLHCWGSNSKGQTSIPYLMLPTMVAAGQDHSCAVYVNGVFCWGDNSYGQMTLPKLTTADNCPAVANADQADLDGDSIGDVCDPDIDGDGVANSSDAFPRDYFESLDTDADGIGNHADHDDDGDGVWDTPLMAAGDSHTCELDGTGVHCWGDNTNGQTTVPALSNPVAIAAGGYHSCAIDDAGVQCWGAGTTNTGTSPEYGQSIAPVLSHPVAITAGLFHTCALDDNGVHCWGKNDEGQATVPALSNPQMVSAGGYHTCALDDNGVQCWGYNLEGQLYVPTLSHPVAVSAGYQHNCAIDDNGVHCWGWNTYGQTNVPNLSHPRVVVAGKMHSCALDDSGVHCWGGDIPQTYLPVLHHPVAVVAGYDYSCAADDHGMHCWYNNGVAENTIPALTLDLFPLDPTEWADSDGDHLGDNSDPLPSDATRLNVLDGQLRNDRRGAAVAFAGDINGDGYGDYVVGIPGYDVVSDTGLPTLKNAGRIEVISGKDGQMLFWLNGQSAGDALGTAVAGGTDIDGDGHPDVVAGAPLAANGKLRKVGSITILYGPDGVRRTVVPGQQAGAQWGSALALGDFDHDSRAEVVVGSPFANDIATHHQQAGSVTVLSGAEPAIVLQTFYGSSSGAHAGSALATGDMRNTGVMNLVIGAPDERDVTNRLAAAGSVTVCTLAGQQLMKVYGDLAHARLGASVAAGDMDGNLAVEIAAGAPGDRDDTGKLREAGSVSVYSYRWNGPQRILHHAGTQKGARLGSQVALADVNGDGRRDLVATAPQEDAPTANPKRPFKDAGSVRAWSGQGDALLGTRYGAAAGDAYGSALVGADVNGDGSDDLLLGLPGVDYRSAALQKDAGRVEVISGKLAF